MANKGRIAIVGGGIIGLTTAVVLQELGYKVRIFSRDSWENTTSYAAGAVSYPFAVEDSERTHQWHTQTDLELEKIMCNPEAGVFWAHWKKCTFDKNYIIPDFYFRLRDARLLSELECPGSYKKGVYARLLLIHVDRYFKYLFNRYILCGGIYEVKEIGSLFDLEKDYDLVINCTGVFAHQFISDKEVYPMRGQIVVVRNPELNYHFAPFEGKNYLYPRGEQCVIGGSADIGAWDMKPDEELTKQILAWAGDFEPRLKTPDVLGVRVGLRPMRPSIRLELDNNLCALPVVHNYGHGGAGYTLSWGCAFTVRDLVLGL